MGIRNADPSVLVDQLGVSRSRNHAGPVTLPQLRGHRRREIVERVLAYTSELPRAEAALLECVLRQGLSVAEVARMRGEPARALRREFRRVIERVLSPIFGFVVHQSPNWTTRRRRVAKLTVIRGLSLRAAAKEMDESVWNVRREREAIDALLEGAQVASRAIHSRVLRGVG